MAIFFFCYRENNYFRYLNTDIIFKNIQNFNKTKFIFIEES